MERPLRILGYVIGLAIVVAGIWVLFTMTPLADFVPAGIVLALILLVIGIGVMMMSSATWTAGRSVVVDRAAYAPPPAYGARPYDRVEREVVYDDDRRL